MAQLELILDLFCYGLILLFGVGITAVFLEGPRLSKGHLAALIAFSALSILAQSICWILFGMERTKQFYPLIIHLPLLVLFTAGFKRPWFQVVTGICSAYLCLQIPRWVSLTIQAVFQEKVFYYVSYIPAICLTYYLLWRYVSGPVSKLIIQSKNACLLVGAVPFFYYLFDYGTTIYTDWLYSGAVVAAEFIPFVVAAFYFVFVVVYYAETQKQTDAQREVEQMAAQVRQAGAELTVLRQAQEQTRRYRHDMRHHLALLQSLAAGGNMARIVDYLHTAQSDLDSFTPVRYCENETANLLLSSFASRAKQAGVELIVDAKLPEAFPLSETELCSLLSNSLENAISAASTLPAGEKKTVSLRSAVYLGKVLLSVENPYVGQVSIRDGLPQAIPDNRGVQSVHGYGTRNIAAIAEAHGGQALFSAENGIFSLKVMLPVK